MVKDIFAEIKSEGSIEFESLKIIRKLPIVKIHHYISLSIRYVYLP